MEPQERDRWLEEPLSALTPDAEAPAPRGGKLRRLFGATPVVATLTALLLMAVTALAWYATQWKEGVTVEQVVVTGANLIELSALEERLHRFRNRPLEEVDIDEVRRALASEPWIRSMAVSKELNGILRVTLEERQPAALLVEGEREMMIDTDGVVLPDDGISARFNRLVKVSGAGRLEWTSTSGRKRLNEADRRILFPLLEAFSATQHARLLLSEIHLEPDNRTWFSVAGSSIRFVVGNAGNFKEKLKKFEIFWQQVVAKKGIDCYESVDLRFRDRVFASEPEEKLVVP
ncbi:MAG TPA: FtsQ-type POTRA domain-containing protein [Chlorobaculum parvum]|uniref:FtsQ-type POTRA domain-containing protein n=1 Tax=Chlorobaculum parvum TaxID=274539 RepID=A0A7C5HHZ2_9CHLB|nr:FtsQ-type POTRA domain-containing protein [Chlorobaculum parvum]